MKITIVLFILFVTGSIKAQTDDRWEFITSTKEVNIYVDKNTIKRSGEFTTAWERFILKETGMHNGYEYTEQIAKIEVDCSNSRTYLISMTYYYKGDLIDTENIPRQPDDVIPASTGEILFNYICSH